MLSGRPPASNDAVDRHEIMEILPQFIVVDSAKSQHFAFRKCRLIGLDENSSVFDPLGRAIGPPR
jgi:hypothetical protein